MDEEDKKNGDSWLVWSKHVLMELESNQKELNDIQKCMTTIKVDVGKLKVKAGVWGALGGLIPVLIALGVWVVKQ